MYRKMMMMSVTMFTLILVTSVGVHAQPWITIHGWIIECETDAIRDIRQCVALRDDVGIYVNEHGHVQISIVGNDKHYPGTEVYLRIDQEKALSTKNTSWSRTEARDIIQRMARGKRILTRYTSWPWNRYVDTEMSLEGFADVWAYLQTHAKKTVAAK